MLLNLLVSCVLHQDLKVLFHNFLFTFTCTGIWNLSLHCNPTWFIVTFAFTFVISHILLNSLELHSIFSALIKTLYFLMLSILTCRHPMNIKGAYRVFVISVWQLSLHHPLNFIPGAFNSLFYISDWMYYFTIFSLYWLYLSPISNIISA